MHSEPTFDPKHRSSAPSPWILVRLSLLVAGLALALLVCLAATRHDRSSAQGGGQNSGRTLPRFSMEIDGVKVAGVQAEEIIGPESEVLFQDGNNGAVLTRPGNSKPGKITITKDWSNTSEWYRWRKAVLDGKVDRKSISVIFHNDAGEEAGRLNCYNCWPRKWVGPALNAKNSGHATEKLEIVFETMEMK